MNRIFLSCLSTFFTLTLFAQDYVVEPIGYNPPHSFENIPTSLVDDDRYSAVIELGFEFEFYGESYTQVVIGTNGVIGFDTSLANGNCPWAFDEDVPSPGFPITNSVLCPYQDYDPSANGEFNYAMYGTEPNRRFVLNIYEVGMFSGNCNDALNTVQVVLYETTNDIDFFIQEKSECLTWNEGRAVLGIVNQNGDLGLVPEGRNTSDSPWEAEQEAWRISFFAGTSVEAYNVNYEVCDTGNGGFEEFDLVLIEPEVRGNQSDVTVSFHNTFLDANNNVNPLASPYVNVTNPETIYARVEDSQGLYATSEVTLSVINCLEVDNDNDGITTQQEDLNGDGFPGNDDTDNDGIPNYLDPDDDNDWVQTSDEITGIGAGLLGGYEYIDTDNDNIENYLDNDDDGDGRTTPDEDLNGNGDPIDDDTDNDGIPNFLDNFFDLSTDDFTNIDFIVAPNPFSNFLEIQGQVDGQEMQISIYSLAGQLVYSEITDGIGSRVVLEVPELVTGMYFLEINREGSSYTQRIVKD